MNVDRAMIFIPVKGNSKRLPGKNMLLFNGKPLFIWTVDLALSFASGHPIIISTEDKKIFNIVNKIYSNNPKISCILRQEYLSKDPYEIKDVCLDYFNWGNQIIPYSTMVMLQPGNPLLTANDVLLAYRMYLVNNRTTVRAVAIDRKTSMKSFTLSGNAINPVMTSRNRDFEDRDFPRTYHSCGSFVIIDIPRFLDEKTFWTDKSLGYVLPKERAVDIDTELDFKVAEFLMREAITYERGRRLHMSQELIVSNHAVDKAREVLGLGEKMSNAVIRDWLRIMHSNAVEEEMTPGLVKRIINNNFEECKYLICGVYRMVMSCTGVMITFELNNYRPAPPAYIRKSKDRR